MKLLPTMKSIAFYVAFVVVCLRANAAPALADDPFSKLTITLTPTWTVATGSDDTYSAALSAIPPNVKPPGSNANGYAFAANGGTTSDPRLDFGLDYRFTKWVSLFYSHQNVDFSLGRFQPGIYTGDIQDRFDTLGVREDVGVPGLSVNEGYFNRSRICCGVPNTPSDNIAQNFYHGYFVGASYAFGWKSPIGPPFDLNVRALWVPRDPSKIIPGFSDDPAVPYTGSGFIYPFSLTFRIPISNTIHTFWPFVSIGKAADYMSGDPGPSYLNQSVIGIVKIFSPQLVFHAVVVNIAQEHLPYPLPQYPGVPLPGENIRVNVFNAGLDFKIKG